MMRKGVDYIRMAQDMDQWWILWTEVNFRVQKETGHFWAI
jgi:hypothetical protein